MKLTNTFTELLITSIPATLKNSGNTDIEITLSNDTPTEGYYSLAPNQYFNIEDTSTKIWVRAKVTEGECKLLNFRHLEPIPTLFLGAQPHPSLVLSVEATPKGLFVYNRFDDKMPINISGGKKLEECLVEETEDYKIYADGGTQVRMGRTGLAQKYIEALNTIYAEEITKGTNIFAKTHMTSDIAFHSHLLDVLNEEHNKEIEAIYEAQLKTKNVMAEEPYLEPLSEQRVFIAINFACRVDKKTGEIYIGEGYENLAMLVDSNASLTRTDNADGTYDFKLDKLTNYSIKGAILDYLPSLKMGDNFAVSLNVRTINNGTASVLFLEARNSIPVARKDMLNIDSKTRVDLIGTRGNEVLQHMLIIASDTDVITNSIIRIYEYQVTKTSTPKPFVKTLMPSGKLSFITNATSETHSYITKGCVNYNSTSITVPLSNGNDKKYQFLNAGQLTGIECDFIYSKNSNLCYSAGSYVSPNVFDNATTEKNIILLGRAGESFSRRLDSFEQLLIYKGNLSETELKAELVKGFRLNPNLYLYPDNILGEVFTRVA